MSMYNLVFGTNPFATLMLHLLGKDRTQSLGRVRDAWLEKLNDGTLRIAVYTRNGGLNREEYMPDLKNDPLYLEDRDDAFDNTYATIYFKVPDDVAQQLKSLEAPDCFNLEMAAVPVVDTSARWKEAIAAIGKKP